MNIVVISTTSLETPPRAYGGMEKASFLTAKGLVELGHKTLLVGKAGSKPPLEDYQNCALLIIDDEHDISQFIAPITEKLGGVDVWIDYTHDKRLGVEHPELPILTDYQVMSVMGNPINPVLISFGQWRGKFQSVKEAEVIYQPISLSECFPYLGERDNYLLYMGQLIPEKRIEWACELAVRTNTPLKIFGPGWGPAEYHKLLREYEGSGLVSIHSDIGGDEKIYTIQHARALVHPVGGMGWCEAGGIIVLEALACGTPVICSNNGALPEYIQQGVNGFLCDTIEEMVDALGKVHTIKPEDCRESALRFDYRLAARQWEKLAQRVASGERWNV